MISLQSTIQRGTMVHVCHERPGGRENTSDERDLALHEVLGVKLLGKRREKKQLPHEPFSFTSPSEDGVPRTIALKRVWSR
uniref:Uncharacterized protein n=1 Tax=Bionectria ochroleuca TaxID=29856 RepID=A0A0B7JHM6_BIOOC